MVSKHRRSRLLWLAALALTSAPALALQVIDARDGVAVEAMISTREPTRIRIDGMPITDVFGNIYSSNCGSGVAGAGTPTPATSAVNPSGELVLECDRDKGEVYVRPANNADKPINLFVSSAAATYTLLLRRADVPADTIIIRDKTARAPKSGAVNPAPAGRTQNHVRALKSMLLAMATDRVPTDLRIDDMQAPRQLWAEARFTLLRIYEGRSLIGEKYSITNISNQAMVLAEQEFDREDGAVAAVAIDNLNLRPGESTHVYVIRLGSGS